MNTRLNVLHLTRRFDRTVNLLHQMEKNDIKDYVIWEGYDDPSNVKKAITRGHKKIIRFAKENGHPNCIIAEDDICFTDNNSYRYFTNNIPDDYDLFFGLIYSGQVGEGNRVLNGMSGTHTLYSISSRFYDFVLNQPDDEHIDRGLGNFCHQFKYYVIDPFVCYQSGGYSDNLKRVMFYDEYLRDKVMYKSS